MINSERMQQLHAFIELAGRFDTVEAAEEELAVRIRHLEGN